MLVCFLNPRGGVTETLQSVEFSRKNIDEYSCLYLHHLSVPFESTRISNVFCSQKNISTTRTWFEDCLIQFSS